MPAPLNRPHILVPVTPRGESYLAHSRKMKKVPIPAPASRAAHGAELLNSLVVAVAEAEQRRAEAGVEIRGAKPALYLQVDSQPGIPLQLDSLAAKPAELVAVTRSKTGDGPTQWVEHATLCLPQAKVKSLITKITAYAQDTPKEPKERRHELAFDPVARLGLANLQSIWTDVPELYPEPNQTVWWEVWLRRHDGRELERFFDFAAQMKIKVLSRRLQFDHRIITLAHASPLQLSSSIDVLNDMAELRMASVTAEFFDSSLPPLQGNMIEELLSRTEGPPPICPSVCIIDTGVNRGHPLLEALDESDCHTCEKSWGAHDHNGHGTEMAGLALYGDLVHHLAGSDSVRLKHCLESVKLLPPRGQNEPEMYSTLTAVATNRVESQAPERQRSFCLAVTTIDSRDRGQPTLWSTAVDALAAGRSFDTASQGLVFIDTPDQDDRRRLFFVSAGNVADENISKEHLERSDIEAVHDPGQAWNAITVGACTEKIEIKDGKRKKLTPVAHAGDLCPWSTTSLTFQSDWPIKPEVVFEGGNALLSEGDPRGYSCADLSLLTTHFEPAERLLTLTWATSPATAQVARIAANISAQYQVYWPETIRGLIVHSARWTARMNAGFKICKTAKDKLRLVRRYGYGVPQMDRALRSANDHLTLIAQGTIHPFSAGKIGEMHLFELPWPQAELRKLGDAKVILRITLSYFIEPNPGRRGWRQRHRYASHGLRFALKRPTDSIEEFRKGLNQKALEEGEKKRTDEPVSEKWFLGPKARDRGSIHSDFMPGTAADIADRGVIGIYPVSGWWKDLTEHDRSDRGIPYSLIVSIETDSVETDIWTPVAQMVGVPIDTLL